MAPSHERPLLGIRSALMRGNTICSSGATGNNGLDKHVRENEHAPERQRKRVQESTNDISSAKTGLRPPYFDAKCMPIRDSWNSISREIKSKHRTNAKSNDLGEAAGHAVMATTSAINPDVPELLCKEGLGRSIKRTGPYGANSKSNDGTSILLARRRH